MVNNTNWTLKLHLYHIDPDPKGGCYVKQKDADYRYYNHPAIHLSCPF